MDQSGRVVAGVDAQQRITHNRLAQVGIGVSGGGLQCGFNLPSAEMHILSDLDEQNCHARVLASWDCFGLGIGRVLQQEFYDLLAGGRMFCAAGRAHGGQIVFRQAVRGMAQKFTHRMSHFFDFNCSQRCRLQSR